MFQFSLLLLILNTTNMKRFVYSFLLVSLFASLLGFSNVKAQQRYDLPIDFQIQRLAWNDTMLFMVLDLQVQDGADVPPSLAGFSARGGLSMCSCYCDSIWDAWPSELGGYNGSGTLTIQTSSSSSSGGGDLNPFAGGRQRQRGALAIKEITDGITRETPFVVPIVYKTN